MNLLAYLDILEPDAKQLLTHLADNAGVIRYEVAHGGTLVPEDNEG